MEKIREGLNMQRAGGWTRKTEGWAVDREAQSTGSDGRVKLDMNGRFDYDRH